MHERGEYVPLYPNAPSSTHDKGESMPSMPPINPQGGSHVPQTVNFRHVEHQITRIWADFVYASE